MEYVDIEIWVGGVAVVNLPISTVMSNLRSSSGELRDCL
jgi:hypothetical protein